MTSLDPTIGAASADPEARADAARKLEAYFLRRMLAEVRMSSDDPLLGGGAGGAVFREMLDEALSDSMAEAGGFGLAAMVSAQLGGDRPGNIGRTAINRADAVGSYQKNQGDGALSVLPVDGNRITSGFGHRIGPISGKPGWHNGVDIPLSSGSPIRAAAGGTVVRAEKLPVYGNMVVIDHGGGLETRYAHMSEMSVRAGDRLEPGQNIGAVGSTGQSAGPHLHFEVRRDGKAVDPIEEMPALKVLGR